MNIILLSGGSGKRLWPLSNDIRSKQFIRLFRAADGHYESMIQRMHRMIREVDPTSTITIATNRTQVSAICNQLGSDVNLSVEPCRRDTFPAIALAAAYLRDVRGFSEEEIVVICPSDPYVDKDYFEALMSLGAQAAKREANLVLMGIQPTYPSEKYGYILPQDGEAITEVQTFKEKPDLAAAEAYIKAGALWNGGVFACRIGYVLEKARRLLQFTDYQTLLTNYEQTRKISFDFAVVEQEKHIQVMRFSGRWMDLGTWNTLTEAMDECSVGNVIIDETCDNVHVLNELSVPVIAMGLRDVVISASPEGILVSDKGRSSHLKQYVDRIQQQVMFAEKSWGSYTVLDVESNSLTVKVKLNPDHRMHYHSHAHRDETWTVVEGEGTAILDDTVIQLVPGVVLRLPSGCRHTVIARTALTMIEVQIGENISVEDKQKFPMGHIPPVR